VNTPQATAQVPFALHVIAPGTFRLRVTGDDDFEGSANSVEPVNILAGQTMQTGNVSLLR
jgi:hypothetical protein